MDQSNQERLSGASLIQADVGCFDICFTVVDCDLQEMIFGYNSSDFGYNHAWSLHHVDEAPNTNLQKLDRAVSWGKVGGIDST